MENKGDTKYGAILTEMEMDELVFRTRGRIDRYGKNEMISLRNRGEQTLFCVQEGLIYLCAENEAYEKSILRVLRPGEIFLSDMVLELTHGVSYLMVKYPARVLAVSREELGRLCATYTRWRERIGTLFSQQLPESMMAQNYILHQKSLRMKLIYYFKHECVLQGGNTLVLPMPFSDLADYLSVDRSAMMKEITRMKREGLITGTRRNILFREQTD